MELLDTDDNSVIDADELANCPGLQAGAAKIDSDGDGQLSREELLVRFQALGSMSDVIGVQVLVLKEGRPLSNANVSLTPAPFLGGGLQPYHGVSNTRGGCLLTGEAVSLPGLPTGYYAVQITQEASGTDSQLGCEIADDASGSRLVLEL